MKVGAGKQRIQIPEGYLAAENFRTVHDPIHARAVVVEEEKTLALISLEITSMPEEEARAIRRLVSRETGIREENIWVCVTHSFSSPHLLPDAMLKTEKNIALKGEYRQALQKAACTAARKAARNMRPASMSVRTGICEIVANRDVELDAGWWVGTKGTGLTDRTVTVIRFGDSEGNLIALISHFAMQSSVMDQSELTGGGKAVTSDVAGNACRKVEAYYAPGSKGNIVTDSAASLSAAPADPVVLFLIGAAGDQAPMEKAVNETFVDGERVRTDIHEEGFAILERLSDQLAGKICELADSAAQAQRKRAGASKINGPETAESGAGKVTLATRSVKVSVPAKKMERDLKRLAPTRSFIYEPDRESETVIEGMRIGDVALIGVRPELNCCTAVSVMSMSDFPTTLVCTMVNGSAKYMADAESYDRITYEAMNSPFGRGAAEIVAERAIALLQELGSGE